MFVEFSDLEQLYLYRVDILIVIYCQFDLSLASLGEAGMKSL